MLYKYYCIISEYYCIISDKTIKRSIKKMIILKHDIKYQEINENFKNIFFKHSTKNDSYCMYIFKQII